MLDRFFGGEDRKNEAGDPGDPQNVGLPDSVYGKRVPDCAVCNEAVKLAKKLKIPGSFRICERCPADGLQRKRETCLEGRFGALIRWPRWMLSMWEEMYGKETSEAIAASFLEERPLTVRFNESISPAEKTIRGELRDHGITVEESGIFPGIASIRGFRLLRPGVRVHGRKDHSFRYPSSSLAAQMAIYCPGRFRS